MFKLETERNVGPSENIPENLQNCQKWVPETDVFDWSGSVSPAAAVKRLWDEPFTAGMADTTLKFVVRQATTALAGRKVRDRDETLGHMQLFQRFHTFSTAIHGFFQELVRESAEFRFGYEYADEANQLWARYTLTFGSETYQRNFPVVVIYQRFPHYAAWLKVDVAEIGTSAAQRTKHTEQLTHGRIERGVAGLSFWAVAPESVADLPDVRRWLKRTFIEIFKLTYES